MTYRKSDFIFIASIAILLAFGLLMLFSASSSESYNIYKDSYFLIKRQLFLGVLPGGILFVIFSRLDFNIWQKLSKPLFIFCVLLLVLVLLPGFRADFGAAKSWFSFFGLSFQPSELAKFGLVCFLATFLAPLTREDFFNWKKSFLPFLAVLGLIGFLLMKQPDLGTFMILFFIAMSMYFIAGGKITHLVSIFTVSIASIVGLIFVNPLRFNRLISFLNSKQDVLGISYHINQALLTIGSGGFWGLGWGHSRQKFQFLPEASSDSIFAIIGEELGFLFLLALLALFGFIFWRGLKIAETAPNRFGKLLVTGIMVWFISQTFINIASMTALLPLTGVPLPLVSHGGSAMAILLAALGIVASVSRKVKE